MRFVSIIPALIAAIVIFIVLFVLIPRVDRFLNISAVSACGNISKFIKENSSEAYTASYPVSDVYDKCLQDTK